MHDNDELLARSRQALGLDAPDGSVSHDLEYHHRPSKAQEALLVIPLIVTKHSLVGKFLAVLWSSMVVLEFALRLGI